MRDDWIEMELDKACGIYDNLRKPINSKERAKRIECKTQRELYPYYGATGQVGLIDDYLTDGEYILIGEDGAPFLDYSKDIAYIIQGKTWVNNHAHILLSHFNNKFLLHYLNQFNFHGFVSGTTRLKLTQTSLKKIPVKLPPIPEQRAIVATIDQLFSDLDNGIANLKAAKAKLEIYRQAVLKKAFEGDLTKEWRAKQTGLSTADELLEQIKEERLEYYQKELQEWELAVVEWEKNGEEGKRLKKPKRGKQVSRASVEKVIELYDIPDTWKFISPEEIASFDKYSIGIGPFGSNLKVMDYKDSGVPIVFVKNITQNNFFLDQKFINENKYCELIAHSIQPLDILITKMGNPPGDCAIYPVDAPVAVITSDCLKFRVFEKYGERRFFKYCIESIFIKRQLGLITQGVAQKKISVARFKTLWFPFCSFEEQTQIVQEIETRLSVSDKLKEGIDQSLEKSEALRQSILKKAFEGKLLSEAELQACRREPDWEPAEKLLACIHKKQTTKSSKKRNS